MRTPEEIKKGLESCSDVTHGQDCRKCAYRKGATMCIEELMADALVYINYLEEHADAFMSLYYANIGKENCANCKYGDGTITDTYYCRDCRWFDKENGRIKWVGTPKSIAGMPEDEKED